MTANNELFPCVRVEGAILPVDLLQRVAAGDQGLEGLRPEDYHLVGEKVNEATSHAWTKLSRIWDEFRPNLDRPPSPGDESLTLKRWLLPFWNALGYGQLDAAKPFEIDGKQYPISRVRYQSPVHLVSFRQDLDKRVETGDGKRPSPHGMVQEFLNRSDPHLWAFVSNGLKLRVLRDNIRLTRQAFVEFDLQAMFEGKAYADFALLWRLCHESRVKPEKSGPNGPVTSDNPADCWLERWSKAAAELGLRALDQLRAGVERAIEALGRGFLHPRNVELIHWLREREPHAREYYRQLLRVVYRLLFMFVAEDRGLLFDPSATEEVRERYGKFYSTARLRRIAEQTRGTPHTDLYHALELVLRPLGRGGCPELGLTELGGLFDPAGTANLNGCVIGNADLLEAVRALSIVSDGKSQRSVDYRNLGSEELGSVYESLLELKPQFTAEPASFVLKSAAGNERKTTGSYYTPTSLITCLLDSALDPVLDEAAKKPDAETAILNLKVCDPACGSGHFLIAAAHRLARKLAAVRTQEEEPAPDAVRHALRDVISRCVYGVDVNPMAVELCQVALWMEAMEPGKPLSFLKNRIQCGNSLLGTTPALLAKGIPDEAFEPIEGDENAYCRLAKGDNKREREEHNRGQRYTEDQRPNLGNLAAEMAALDTLPDNTPAEVRAKADRYERLASESGYRTSGRFLSDLWCAAFVWRKAKGTFDYPITERIFRRVERNPHDVTPWMVEEVVRLRDQYQFFHWHLAFPGVFRPASKGGKADNELTGWCGGFDVVLGNPPWERTSFEEVPYFLSRVPHVAEAATTAERRRRIEALRDSNPSAYHRYQEDRRQVDAEDAFYGGSGLYPHSSGGRTNTYALFADLTSRLIRPTGRSGLVIPTGVATDAPMQQFWTSLIEHGRVTSLFDFENQGRYFPAVHSSYKFCLLTLTGAARPAEQAVYGFFLGDPEDVHNPGRVFTMTPQETAAVNPTTRQPPVCRTRRDLNLLLDLQRKSSHVGRQCGAYVGLTSASTSEQWILEAERPDPSANQLLAMYEAKMIHQFQHRFATYEGVGARQRKEGNPQDCADRLSDPGFRVVSRFLIPQAVVDAHLARKSTYRKAIPAYRDVARSTDERTLIAAMVPVAGLMQPLNGLVARDCRSSLCHVACLNSFATDYAARLKTPGTHVNVTICDQLPIISEETYLAPCPWMPETTHGDFVLRRALELSYTAWDLEAISADCGFAGPPFRWNEERRFLIRCELDAAYFHLYGVGRDDAEYILETFPIVKRKDIERHGRYRTKEQVLAVYDALAEAARSGQPYSSLDPPPADPRCRHADRTGTIAHGAVRTINDLLAALPDGPFPLRLTEADLGSGQPADWTCQPLTDGEPTPAEGTWVLLRSDGLRRGPTPLAIAAGRLSLNPIAGGMEVMLKGAIPPATLRLTAEQWKTFRPLAILTPLAPQE